MSQQAKSPAVMIRIERRIEDLIRGLAPAEAARRLMEQGWIDTDWAGDHTRMREAAPNVGSTPEGQTP